MSKHEFTPDWDLLQPTLTDADDLRGFNRPYNPWSLVLVVFFAGILYGSLMQAWNFHRLGRRRGVVLTVVTAVVVYALTTFSFVAIVAAIGPEKSGDYAQLSRFGLRLSWVIPALVVAKLQQRRFRVFQHGDEEPASALPIGLALFLAWMVTEQWVLSKTFSTWGAILV